MMQRDQKAKAISANELHVQMSGLKTLTGLAISRDGSYAVLAGASTLVSSLAHSARSAKDEHAAQYACVPLKQDADCITLLFIDLTEGKGPLLKQSASSEKRKGYPVHPDLFCHRPGLRVLQVTWHPGSRLTIIA